MIGMESLPVHTIGHDIDVAIDAKHAACFPCQIGGHGRDAIRASQRIARDPCVRRILPNDRDVGAMQGRDHGQPAGCDNVAHGQSRHRVRNRVVRVNQVERYVLGDFGESRRKRKVVGRILEERIGRHRNFVEMDAGVKGIVSRRRRIGKEVHVMPTLRQRLADFRRHDTRAAEGRVAEHADRQRTGGRAHSTAHPRLRKVSSGSSTGTMRSTR